MVTIAQAVEVFVRHFSSNLSERAKDVTVDNVHTVHDSDTDAEISVVARVSESEISATEFVVRLQQVGGNHFGVHVGMPEGSMAGTSLPAYFSVAASSDGYVDIADVASTSNVYTHIINYIITTVRLKARGS